MDIPDAIFPLETYLDGLRNADEAVVEGLYNEFRQPVTRAVEAAGGSYADGNTFFRVAVIQTAQWVQEGKYPEGTPIGLFIKNLSIAQYQDWVTEKGQELPPSPVPEPEELAIIQALPSSENQGIARKQIRAKRFWTRLSTEDQQRVQLVAARLAQSENETTLSDAERGSIERYKTLMGKQEGAWENILPNWVVFPITNAPFHAIWAACESVEKRIESSQIPASGANKAILYAFFGLVILTFGYGLVQWLVRDKTPAEVYDNHYNPPKSILVDLAARYAQDSIAPVRPERCQLAFQEADQYYQKKEWREAATSLAEMMDDSLLACQTDALFYLAIVGLELERPDLSLECIAKMDDLERYGEDIYWYMALAYVQKAALDPTEKDIAKRAVERALSNTEIPERRQQAEKMLEELSE